MALDLDGVVWKGGVCLPGVAQALADVLRRGLDLRYVSNNSTAHRETVSERLEGLGLPAGADRVLTSGFVTGRWLRERLPEGAPVMVVGEEGLLRELREAGLKAYHAREARRTETGRSENAEVPGAGPTAVAAAPGVPGTTATTTSAASPTTPAALVVGMDRSFSYDALAAAQAAVLNGALFVATNSDATFPTPTGLLPGAGSIVAAVATAAGKEPVFMGKPGLALAETLAAVTGVPAAQTLFVGDRLETDIAMGRAAGMTTVLVLTGVTCEKDARCAGAAQAPDHILSDLTGLPELLGSLGA